MTEIRSVSERVIKRGEELQALERDEGIGALEDEFESEDALERFLMRYYLHRVSVADPTELPGLQDEVGQFLQQNRL